MKRLRIFLLILLVIAVAAPAMAAPVSAPLYQEDEGFLGWVIQQFTIFFDFIANLFQGIINFFGDLLRGLLNLVVGFIGWIIDNARLGWERLMALINWIFAGIRQLWDWFLAGLRLIGELIGIGVLIIQIIIGLGLILIAYIGQLIALIFGLVTTFTTAAPTPVPGMPRCVSAPLDYELCAAWYFLENTLFSGDVGGIIIGIAVLYIDLQIIFYVGGIVLKIVRRGESVTHVQ